MIRSTRRAALLAVLTTAAMLVGIPAASAVTGAVTTNGGTLTLRATPSGSGTALANIPNGTSLELICRTSGTSVSGNQGTTTTWDRVTYAGKTGYVSAAWVRNGTHGDVPDCDAAVRGTVRTNGGTLTLRSTASAGGTAVANIPNGTTLTLQCRTSGTSVSGSFGTTSTWVRTTYGGGTGYVSGAWVSNAEQPAACGSTPPPGGGSSLQNPHPGQIGANGGWTARAAWLRDQVKSRFGITCTTYATSGSSEHATGNGLDCWGTVAQRRELQYWAAQNARPLEVYYVIHEQRIWSLPRAGEGWRAMADRGSPTANHYDHVHISMQNPRNEY